MHDAARQAALDERDRVAPDLSDYIVGRIVEAAIAVLERRPPPPRPRSINVHSQETEGRNP